MSSWFTFIKNLFIAVGINRAEAGGDSSPLILSGCSHRLMILCDGGTETSALNSSLFPDWWFLTEQ